MPRQKSHLHRTAIEGPATLRSMSREAAPAPLQP